MDDEPMTVARLEEMLASVPGESWTLLDAEGRETYGAGPPGGLLGHGGRPGGHIAEFGHPDDLPAAMDAMQAVLAHPGMPVRVLSRARRADGTWGVYEVTGVNRLDDPLVAAIVVRTREVTGGPAEEGSTLIESLAEAVPTPILVIDAVGTVLYGNIAARTLLGDEIATIARRLVEQRTPTTTIPVGDRWVQARLAERADGLVVMLDDITSQHRLAMHDSLTGLANRAAFDEQLRLLLSRPDRPPVSVMFVDLDGFKAVNDQHGHAGGDRVLQLVAERLRSEVRPADLLARLGGDEFAVVCDGLDPNAATRLADRLAAAVREPFDLGGVNVSVGASAGAATNPPAPADPAGLVAAADRAMYERKRA